MQMTRWCPSCEHIVLFVQDQFAQPGLIRCGNCFDQVPVDEAKKYPAKPQRRESDANSPKK